MTIAARLSKPHYLFRPSQLIRRARLAGDEAESVVQTPWGCPMLVSRGDAIGAGIARMGIHELAVSETIWRLAGGDELALDVGANIGYFTGLLAQRAAHVIALEPNPRLRRFITQNIERCGIAGRVTLDTRAASDVDGTATLRFPAGYQANYGVATLAATNGSDEGASDEVGTVRLDELIAGRGVGVMKLDVEGHEATALRGAGGALAAGLVRDIVFEEHEPLPSEVSRALERAGFAIRGIEEHLAGPRLVAPGSAAPGWDAPTYLATREPQRAERLMAGRGWRCLRRSRRR